MELRKCTNIKWGQNPIWKNRKTKQNRKQINDKQDDKGKFGINLRTNAGFCKKRNEKCS